MYFYAEFWIPTFREQPFRWHSNYFNKTILIHRNFKSSKYNDSDTLNTMTVVKFNLLALNTIKKYINLNCEMLFKYVF